MRIVGTSVLLLALAGCTTGPDTSQAVPAAPIVEQLREKWEATRNQIATAAEAVPEDKYDFKATPEVRSFRELLIHLVSENYLFMGMVSGETHDRERFNSLTSRDEILQALTESYDYGAGVLAGLSDADAVATVDFRGAPEPRWVVVIRNLKDNHEHYGNLVTYLRLNGIVPPRTAARQRNSEG